MASSWVGYKDQGFWVRDYLVKAWLYAQLELVKLSGGDPDWKNPELVDYWANLIQVDLSGSVDPLLDKYIPEGCREQFLASCKQLDVQLTSLSDMKFFESLNHFQENRLKKHLGNLYPTAEDRRWFEQKDVPRLLALNAKISDMLK